MLHNGELLVGATLDGGITVQARTILARFIAFSANSYNMKSPYLTGAPNLTSGLLHVTVSSGTDVLTSVALSPTS